MGRKKREPIDLVEENLEDLAAESRELEAESLEEQLDELEAEEAEEVTEVLAVNDENEDTVVEEMPKPKKKRAPRRKKAEAKAIVVEEEAAAEVEPSLEVEMSSDEGREEAPSIDVPSREESPAPVSPAFDPKEDPTVRQWELIRQISESIVSSLERASGQIAAMPKDTAAAFQANFRAPVAKPAPITKIAVLAAGLALVLSFLSLSFAQSARQSVLAKESVASAPIARVKEEAPQAELPPVRLKPAPPVAQEIARAQAPSPRPRVAAPAPRVAPPKAKAAPVAPVKKRVATRAKH